MKSRKMRLMMHVDRLGRGAYRVLVWRREGKGLLGRLSYRGKIILKGIFRKWSGETWTGLLLLRIGTSSGLL
jgi:hypothetical protein